MAICPLMSNWVCCYTNTIFKEKECIEDQCALWDSENNRCGLKVSDISQNIYLNIHEDNDETKRSIGQLLKDIINYIHEDNDETKRSIGQLLTLIKQSLHEDNDETKRAIGQLLKSVIDYIHEDNDETKRSIGQLLKDIINYIHEDNDESKKSIGEHIATIDYKLCWCHDTKIQVYLQEFLTFKDLDNNGKIYGKDFKLANPPPLLKSLENSPYFNRQAPTVTEEI
jgi:hypothetical protein